MGRPSESRTVTPLARLGPADHGDVDPARTGDALDLGPDGRAAR